jgi:hypothetical protein
MSYTQVKTLEPGVDDDHEELVGSSRRSADEHVPHAYFKSSASLHTAISIAAGTVCCFPSVSYFGSQMSKLIGIGHDAVRLRTRWVIRPSSIRIQTNSLEGVFGGIIVGQDFIEYFNHPSPAMQGFVTSVYDLGCFVGAIITLFIGERLGRRWTMLVFTVIMGSGIIFQTASHSMTQMVGSISRY